MLRFKSKISLMLSFAFVLILCFVAMWFYPLYGKSWNEKKEYLAKKHVEKEKAYEQELSNQTNNSEQSSV